jgi:hypothetical protein
MIHRLRYGIGNESIKCIRGNRSRADKPPEQEALENNHIHLTAAKRDDTSFQVFIEADDDFILSITNSTVFHPKTIVTGGILAKESADLMKRFFKEKR